MQIHVTYKSKNDLNAPRLHRWIVKRSKSTLVIASAHTQYGAYRKARRLARLTRAEVFVHRKDGRIRYRNSFGNDPRGRG